MISETPLDRLLSAVSTEGVRSYYLFETFVLELLGRDTEMAGRPFIRHFRRRTQLGVVADVDGFAPKGLHDLKGPLVVDVQFSRSTEGAPGSGLVARHMRQLRSAAVALEARTLLIVVAGRLRHAERDQLQRPAEQQANIDVVIWDAREIARLAERHAEFSNELLSQLPELRLQAAVRRDDTDWQATRDLRLSNLRDAYGENDVALFLGAGVSIAAGLPDWDTLLDKLFVHLLTRRLKPGTLTDPQIEALVRRFKSVDDPSPLMMARYLRRGLSDPTFGSATQFSHLVSQVLYENYASGQPASALNAAISRICLPERNGPRTRSVVTYNFDDLLEEALRASGVRHRSIYAEAALANQNELAVYHVHGFLPRDATPYDNLDQSKIIFSEEGYHDLMGDPYSWPNLVQLTVLRERTVVMIGLSLTDPNLRRLLEIAGRRNGPGRHYAFMKRLESGALLRAPGRVNAHLTTVAVSEFLNSHHQITEQLYEEFGVNIIWFEQHAELPGLIMSLRPSV